MAALLENPNFWYTICGVAIVLLAVFVIKGYVKRLSQGCCGSGSGENVGKVRVGDKDKSHYPYAVVLTIDGMVCGNCARRVENALNALDGVWAIVDVGAKQALVRMKRPVEEQVLRDTVNHIGAYTVMAVAPSSS